MEHNDLLLKHYRVEEVLDGIYPTKYRIVAIEDPNGNYKASSAKQIEKALNTYSCIRKTDNLFYRMSPKGKWHPMIRRI